MKKENELKAQNMFGRFGFIIVFLAVLAILILFTLPAYADIAECYRSVKSNQQINDKEYTILVFSGKSGCDLYGAIRLYPQLNPDTKERLSVQEQLRSLYAANEKVDMGGRQVRTVLRGCVPNSKPWPDQTAEERDFCQGKVNYYQNGFGGPVLIPHTRQLSRGEKLESAFSKACTALKARSNLIELEEQALNDCQRLIANFEIDSSVKKEVAVVPKVETSSVKKDEGELAIYLEQMNGLKNQIADLEVKAQRSMWLWPLFSLMVGFAIFGASGTIFGIKERRVRQEVEMRHKLFVQGSREVVIKSKDTSASQAKMEEQTRKIEKRLREEMEIKYRERIKRERMDLEIQLEAKYNGISANLAKKNLNLEQALEKARDELITASETLTKELRLKITLLTEECDKERSKANDLLVETEALKQELRSVECRCKQGTDELEALKDRFAESELEVKALEQLNLDLKQEVDELAGKAGEAQEALQALEERYTRLLAAQEVLLSSQIPTGSKISDHRKTLPIGQSVEESFDITPEGSAYSMVLDRGAVHGDQRNISSSDVAREGAKTDEDGVIRDPMTTLADELRPVPCAQSSPTEKKVFHLDRDPDDEQGFAEQVTRPAHDSQTTCKVRESSSEEEERKKTQDAS